MYRWKGVWSSKGFASTCGSILERALKVASSARGRRNAPVVWCGATARLLRGDRPSSSHGQRRSALLRRALVALPFMRHWTPPLWLGWAIPLIVMAIFVYLLRSFFLR